MHKLTVVVLLIICSLNISLAQTSVVSPNQIQNTFSYAYIRIEGKFLSKKLKVEVDLGDSDAQNKDGETLSEILTNKKSYAAVLNYMSEIGYELVNTLDLTSSYNGSGGSAGIVFVMKKAK